KWLFAWECFCKHSFELPQIYSLLYMEHLGTIPDELMQNYYQVCSNGLIDLSADVQAILHQHNIATRSSVYIQPAVDERSKRKDDIEYIADTTMLIWTGMLTNMLNLRSRYSKKEATARTMSYIYKSIMYTLKPEKRDEITYTY